MEIVSLKYHFINATMTIRFSVITCTLNSAKFLGQTLHSLSKQEDRDFEHIFVDGGSTDNTLQMINELTGNVRLIQNITGGISRAMNVGIEAAHGEIILHLHSDDYLAHPKVLSRVNVCFNAPTCEWLYGRTLTDYDGRWTPEVPHFHPYSYSRLLKGNIIPHPATFVRRSVFKRLGLFNENLRYAMDYDMWLRVGSLINPIQVREFFSVFRAHAGSMTYANKLDSFTEDHMVRRSHLQKSPLHRFAHEIRYLKRKWELERLLANSTD